MKFANDVPGYVQGHRFSQDRRYYDATSKRFYDLAGYDRFGGGVEWRNGTATFSNHGSNSREGLILDNSNQWQFVPSIPWEGTMLLVLKPVLNTVATTVLYPWLFGGSVAPTSNGTVSLTQFSGDRRISCQSFGAVGQLTVTGLTNSALTLIAFSRSQTDRKVRCTQDGVTVTASSAVAIPSPTNGEGIAIGAGASGGLLSRVCRLGNNSGTDGDTAASATDYLYLFEQHFFKGDQLTDNLAAMKDAIDTLKTYYAIA